MRLGKNINQYSLYSVNFAFHCLPIISHEYQRLMIGSLHGKNIKKYSLDFVHELVHVDALVVGHLRSISLLSTFWKVNIVVSCCS